MRNSVPGSAVFWEATLEVLPASEASVSLMALTGSSCAASDCQHTLRSCRSHIKDSFRLMVSTRPATLSGSLRRYLPSRKRVHIKFASVR